MKSWRWIFIAIALCGLLVGWLSDNAFIGLAFIWVSMIAVEVLSSKREREKIKKLGKGKQ